jgi:hypothetical protein
MDVRGQRVHLRDEGPRTVIAAAGYAVAPQSVPPGFRLAKLPLLNRLAEHLLPRVVIEDSVRAVYAPIRAR